MSARSRQRSAVEIKAFVLDSGGRKLRGNITILGKAKALEDHGSVEDQVPYDASTGKSIKVLPLLRDFGMDQSE